MARPVAVSPPCAFSEPPAVLTVTVLAAVELKNTIPWPLLSRSELKSMLSAPVLPALTVSVLVPSPITTSRSALSVRVLAVVFVTVMSLRTLMSELMPVAVNAMSPLVAIKPVVVIVPAFSTVKPPLVPVLVTPVIDSVAAVFFSWMLPIAPAPLLVPLKLPTVFAPRRT